MVAQVLPLVTIAANMGMSVPAVIEYFQGENIDLSGYGANDLVDLETLFPQTESERIKEYETYDESFYDAPPVVGATSLDNIIIQSKKEEDPVEVSEDELEVMPSQELSTGEGDPEPPDPDWKWKPNWRDIASYAMEKVLDKQVKELEKNITTEKGYIIHNKLYHGSTTKDLNKLTVDKSRRTQFGAVPAISLSDDKNLAQIFVTGELGNKEPGQVYEVSGNFKIIDLNTKEGKNLWDNVYENNPQKALADGFDGVQFKNLEHFLVRDFHKNVDFETIKDANEIQLFEDVDITTDTGLNFPKEKTDNNTRLHNLRLQNIIDGKAENYPGGPQNDRIVINAPEGSNLPPIAIGNITYKDWEDKITLDDTQIMEAANWYEKIFSSLEVMAGDDKNLRDTLVKAWLSGQINETPSSALNNVIYVYEQFKRGVPFEDVKGKGLPAATNNVKSIIYGKEIEGGIGPKISDFIDAGLNSNTRSWMGNSSSGGQPFVVDVHTARDTGLVDQTYLNHLEKLGYIIPEDIKIDVGVGGVPPMKYENRALFGQGLTKYLNDKKWMGKSDWKPSEIQAIGWMNLTNMYAEGNQSGDILKALNRNLRRIAMEVDPAEGSPWQITYGEKYNKLDDDKKFTISEKVTAKAIEMVNELTGVDFSGNVYGTGGWELYQNPSTVQEAYISKEAAKDAAAKLGFLLNQTEVWVNTAKDLTKNPQHFALDIIEAGDTNLRESNTLKSLFERIINNDPAQIFRGYHPVVVQGEPGIRIIIDKDAISQAIKEKRIKKADVLPYIQEFTKTGLNEAIKDLDFDVNTYISEVELEKLTNDWIKIKNGQSFIDNFSKDTRTTTEGGDRTNIYNLAKQLTQFFARFLQEESTAITDTTKKITKKKLGGSIEIPKFHFGGFINTLRV